MAGKLTEYELKRMSKDTDRLNAEIGLQSDTIKDIKYKINEQIKVVVKLRE
jgi:hypothetical protein